VIEFLHGDSGNGSFAKLLTESLEVKFQHHEVSFREAILLLGFKHFLR
jgi:hypothetical protein